MNTTTRVEVPKYVVTSDGTPQGTVVMTEDGKRIANLTGLTLHMNTDRVRLDLSTAAPIGMTIRCEVSADQVEIKYESIRRQIWLRIVDLYRRAEFALARWA